MATSASSQPELRLLHAHLSNIHHALANFQPMTAKPPILDSSLDLNVDPSVDDAQWLNHELIPGLKSLRDAVKRDFDVLGKFLEDPASAHQPAPSTNAPYLIAVWNEVLCAPPPIVSIFKSITLPTARGSDPAKRHAPRPPGTKVDVVANNGRRWIRVNTVKNARMLAEFREIDSYLTDSDSDTYSDSSSAIPTINARPSLAQTEFDNSVLRMGRALLAAAQAHPVEGTTEIPQVVLRLTRLDDSPVSPDGTTNDPRIAQTIGCLRDMGVVVELGERSGSEIALSPLSSAPSAPAPPLVLEPTVRINLDLSVLIALVSDLAHAPLPGSIDEANTRFVPPSRYREWKHQRLALHGRGTDLAEADADDIPPDLGKHSRALANQVLQEMGRGMLQEIRDRIAPLSLGPSSPTRVEFWTTPEARDRCIRIVTKIGGASEQRRLAALFPNSSISQEQAEDIYWRESRYPPGFIPLLPIRLHSASEPPARDRAAPPAALPLFFGSLCKTCRDILAQEAVPHPRARPDAAARGEIERAAVTRANARLTAHTVQSMLWGAELGWTTLTANKTSVKAILREMKVAKVAGRLDGPGDVVEVGGGERDVGGVVKAAFWIVDPRSLAEGMRSDIE